MRKGQRETFHGTAVGQLFFPDELRDRLDLSEREAVVACLLTLGHSQRQVAERLGITSSTASKHLAQVRRKLGVETTSQAALRLASLVAESTPDSSPATNARYPLNDSALRRSDREFARRLANASDLDDLLRLLAEHLRPLGVGGLFYTFLPLGVASFRDGSLIERQVAPEAVVASYRLAGGAVANPISHRIFADPEMVVRIDGTDPKWRAREEANGLSSSLVDALLDSGFRYSVILGAPFGPGFVGVSAFLTEEAEADFFERAAEQAESIRSGVLLAQSAAFSFGALAGTIGLTVRERDALSHLGAGLSTGEAAAALGISDRACSDLVRTARTKLLARTTSGAICKATALNALVFL